MLRAVSRTTAFAHSTAASSSNSNQSVMEMFPGWILWWRFGLVLLLYRFSDTPNGVLGIVW